MPFCYQRKFAFLKILAVFFCLVTSQFTASGAGTDSSMKYDLTPGGIFDKIVDMYGNTTSLYQLAINDRLRNAAGPTTAPLVMSTCSSGYFQLWMEPGSGMENFASNPTHMARLSVVCQVLNDISSFIHCPLSSTGQKVNIYVRDPTLAGLPLFAGAAATPYYALPYAPTLTTSGIADNLAWITMHSGVDAYTNVISPVQTSTSFFHAKVAINFSGGIVWNTDLSRAPLSNEADLYSIFFHEVMHALGLVSLINPAGNSAFNVPYYYYGRYDQFLQNAAGTYLISNSGSCSMYNYTFRGTPTDLHPNIASCITDHTVCGTAVRFVDGSMVQPVYTPNCWEIGSSLSHIEDECKVPVTFSPAPPASNNLYFAMSNAISLGKMKRYLKGEERQIMCDLGYQCDPHFGHVYNLNDTNYGTGATCPGINVAGIIDGLGSGGNYLYVAKQGFPDTLNGTVIKGGAPFAYNILANDYNADSFVCAEVIIGSGTLNVTAGTSTSTLIYTPSSTSTPGVHLIRYVPVNGATGARGNITYIYVYVGSGNCTPSGCNLVNNGGFESSTFCGTFATYAPFIYTPSTVDCWSAVSSLPFLYSKGCPAGFGWFDCNIPTTETIPSTDIHAASIGTNNHFINLTGAAYDNTSTGERILQSSVVQTTLNTGLQPGNTYVVTYWAKIETAVNPALSSGYFPTVIEQNTHIQFCASQSVLAPIGGAFGLFYPLKPGIVPLAQHQIIKDANNWHSYTDTFKYTGTDVLNNFIIANAPGLNSYTNDYTTNIYFDDVSLQPLSATTLFTAPDTLRTSDTVADLGLYVTIPGGSFTGPGVVYTGGKYKYYPYMSGPGVITVTYNYTDGAGCSQHVVHDFIVLCAPSSSLRVTANINPVCNGRPVVITASGANNYSWTVSSGSVFTNCINCSTSANTDYPGGTTIYTATSTISGCIYQVSDTVTTNPLPTPSISPSGTVSICAGTNATLSASPTGSYTYLWSNGSTTPTISVSGGGYSVTVTNSATHCFATSAPTTINTIPLPSYTLSPSGSVSACGSVVLHSGVKNAYITQWQWNGSNISGASDSNYTATGSGTYRVVLINGCGTVTSPNINVTITGAPAPTIIYNGNTVSGTSLSICYGDVISTPTVAGYTYQWYLNGTMIAGATSANYTVTGSGSYTVVAKSAPTCSGTSTAATITVFGTASGCSPCTVFGGSPGTAFTMLGCTTCTSANFATGGKYFVPGNITLSGTMTIKNADIMVNGGSNITLASGARVTLDSAHLFGCNPLWNGITYNGNPAVLNMIHSTLIEDAVTAVNMTSVPSSTSNIFTSDGAIFNRNQLGILISAYQSTSLSVYPFTIRNTVFTSRNLVRSYNSWPGVDTLKMLSGTPDGYRSPYILNNYTSATLQNGAVAQMGMQIQSVGSGGSLYREIKVGDETADGYLNVMDNMQFGIYAHNSNMSVVNSAFCNMVGAPNQGNGILADCNATQDMVYRLRVYAGTTSRANKFYNCSADAVGSFYPAEFLFQGNYVISTHTNSWPRGCFVKTANYYASLQASNNTLVNVETGINIATTTNVSAGAINMNSNYIQATPPAYSSGVYPANRYIGNGIAASNAASNTCNTCKTTLNANSNNIADAYNGILLNSFGNMSTSSANLNTIVLIKKTFGTQQSGIACFQMSKPYIYSNIVTSAGGTLTSDTSIDAVRVGNSTTNGFVNCNTVSYMGKAFEFTGAQSMQWVHNTMNSHHDGLFIRNGFIGPQMNVTVGAAKYGAINDNTWLGPYTNQTYLLNSVDTFSRLYFTAAGAAPISNGSNSSVFGYKYLWGTSLLIKTYSVFIDPCPAPVFNPWIALGPTTKSLHFSPIMQWKDQNALYRSILEDSTAVDSLDLISDFYTLASTSRYATLANIENALAIGDYSTAASLLGGSFSAMSPTGPDGLGVEVADYDSANQVVSNYLSYYNLYLNYRINNLSSTDSGQISYLASLCPDVNGDVVYQARALYNLVYNNLAPFDDKNCLSGTGMKMEPNQPLTKTLSIDRPQYILFPNPSNGDIQLQQLIQDKNPVRAEVWNEQGQRILQNTLLFNNGKYHLDLKGIMPGIYLLQLRDSNGRNYLLKFTVN
ncbi:hypothetical protein BDD43_4659 [Mucilaginibacter gracilis]|uniref:Secretion system C-terminal sorting domain-containing protein n=1 Tax=Mucilaginibacter gracilis TaxID=423350 RepID=A0A495J7T8_9SPHI|nr:T9SS type A sorting domain-containing protein [Mucilaginibacter gracilis]RKR84424.1 hypothetical protein BDD43_4659 [Mucilaginibacter gracilis]